MTRQSHDSEASDIDIDIDRDNELFIAGFAARSTLRSWFKMVWIPPPHLAGDGESYMHMYNKIISDHRRAILPSAAAVILLVAPNVDALCASRMLAILFKQDDVGYRIIPVSGRLELEKVAVELQSNTDVSFAGPSTTTTTI